jgi:hypothetical protein
MHLVGRLSNPTGPLKTVLDALPNELSTPNALPEALLLTGRGGNGVVLRAVFKALQAAGGPMRPCEVQPAAAQLLGHPVSIKSIQ